MALEKKNNNHACSISALICLVTSSENYTEHSLINLYLSMNLTMNLGTTVMSGLDLVWDVGWKILILNMIGISPALWQYGAHAVLR